MAVATLVQDQKRTAVLRDACRRNTPVELHFEHTLAKRMTARVRMLTMDAECLYTDVPHGALRLHADLPLTGYFLLAGTRYSFNARVVRAPCWVPGATGKVVAGMALTLPEEIHERQRRADFRLPLVGKERIFALLHEGCPELGGFAPSDARHFPAWLVNISAGGLGVVVEATERSHWPQDDLYFATFRLPETDGEFYMMTAVRHSRAIRDGRANAVGLEFAPWSIVPLAAQQRRITRFIAEEQRKSLRRIQ